MKQHREDKQMILYTDEARNSWKKNAHEIKQTVGTIPGNYISYIEASRLSAILDLFCMYVDEEQKRIDKQMQAD